MSTIRVAIVGLGKIARDQHLPAIARSEDFELVAIASRSATADAVPSFATLEDLIGSGIALDAVSLCTPPQGRHAIARAAIDAGLHVMLEKPPGASVSEVHDLAEAAKARGVSLFASWHTRAAPAIEPARALLAERNIESVKIVWREDVRRWHPGQEWIWEPAGMGVFDPGINALSAATRILPRALFLSDALLSFPENRVAPIAARLSLSDAAGTPIDADFDWRETGPQSWDIHVATKEGPVLLSKGGAALQVNGETVIDGGEIEVEYPNLYARFAELVRGRNSDVDLAPLRLVADAFMLGRREPVEAFFE
ncbi:Gfo/Idh/MocA family protein [Sphingosinicella sp. BN140058]|uniref:Gfo/Idh/MocA family protein n=1 Tax=Sphingosinicella sp. BN140058 TaxID=1892855 RepID=UPI001011729F|nr:Gfo/Idh/MocA family oxidoreductase [Sphingosinicella sp. BN140058]QAY75441.1 Gfo/Idh/MocA family oxidoreductase [Sphingosinicella sp. BN140058]